jgi:hypothetical protein
VVGAQNDAQFGDFQSSEYGAGNVAGVDVTGMMNDAALSVNRCMAGSLRQIGQHFVA